MPKVVSLVVPVLDSVPGLSDPTDWLGLPPVWVTIFVLGSELYVPKVVPLVVLVLDKVWVASEPVGAPIVPFIWAKVFVLVIELYVCHVNVSFAVLDKVQGVSEPRGMLVLPSVRVRMFVLSFEDVACELTELLVLLSITVVGLLLRLEVYVLKANVRFEVIQGTPVPVGDCEPSISLEIPLVRVVRPVVTDVPVLAGERVEREEFHPVNEELTLSLAPVDMLVILMVRVGNVIESSVGVDELPVSVLFALADDCVEDSMERLLEVIVEFHNPVP